MNEFIGVNAELVSEEDQRSARRAVVRAGVEAKASDEDISMVIEILGLTQGAGESRGRSSEVARPEVLGRRTG